MRNLLNPGVHVLGFRNSDGNLKVPIKGSDISPSSTLTKEVLTRGMSSGGNQTHLNYKWELELQFADKLSFEELQDFPKTQSTALEIWKTNGFFTWRNERDVLLSEAVITDPESEDYPYTVKMTFIGPDPMIKESVNYLAPWSGLDSPYWDVTGDVKALSFNQNNETQTVDTLSTGTIEIYTKIYAPFSRGDGNDIASPRVQFIFNAISLPEGADVVFRRRSFLANGDYSGIEITSNITATGDQGTGTTNFASGITGIELGFRIENITQESSFIFRDPYIVRDRNDGLTQTLNEFVNY